ncbi:ImmA/IrrE family metallo-endopeptidase [Paenibacillus chitinolyticus]|uniref:ImmA/IrrE family metallo-endopeptidase n=1 Tax=Paenibacillus chitinolyticus TaxID=79263 RepID=UPI0026E4D43D|nr:ImmA/IrrE family metallo-endopeptidase [Paenibacillus chitinolyticus]GKS14736.1 ImmA/IrrE family metallo-endopeptidase [Paenibacillus chitinolyticus]
MEMDRIILGLMKKYKTNCPFRLAEELHIEVWYEDLGETTRGMYHKKLRRKYIVIHSRLSKYWQRVICAHELGHALMHPGISRFWMDEQTFFAAGKYERQANQFAVKLLIGDDKLNADETIFDLLQRNGIPEELHIFF